jgi:hypothetical protein
LTIPRASTSRSSAFIPKYQRYIHSPCSCVKVPIRSFTLAYGNPFPSKMSSHCLVVFVIVMSLIQASRRSRFSTRLEFTANRSSVIHSGLPSPLNKISQSLSFPPPKSIAPSDVGNERYGTTEAECVSILSLIHGKKGCLTMRSSPSSSIWLPGYENRLSHV